jgi:AmpD protein
VAEFFNETGKVYYEAKKRWVKVSAHISWSGKIDGFVQCVPFSHVAWHCGGSRFRGERKLNFCSIGIELPGPWEKDRDEELPILRETVENIMGIIPSIKVAVRHSDIDSRKKDPGPGFDWACLRDLGLELPFS